MRVNSSRVLALSVARQRSSLGSSRNPSGHTSVCVTVRVVGASLGIYSSRILVTPSGFLVFRSGIRLGIVGLGLRSGSRSIPLSELVANVSRCEVPSGSGIPLRLRGSIPLRLGLRGSIPLRLRLMGRCGVPLGLRSLDVVTLEAGIVPALIVLTILNSTALGSHCWSGIQMSRYSRNGVSIPQWILVDREGFCVRVMEACIVTNWKSGAEGRVHASWVLGWLLGRDRHEGHRHKGLEGKKKNKRTRKITSCTFESTRITDSPLWVSK